MKQYKVYLHDIRCGLFRWRYLVAALLFVLSALHLWDILRFESEKATWMDFMIYIFKGSEPLSNLSTLEQLKLPISWIMVLGGCLFLNLDYFLNDMTTTGQQILIRCNSRKGWFLSKCVWIILSCIAYYGIGMIAILFLTISAGGDLSIINNPVLTQEIYLLSEPVAVTSVEAICIGIVLPLLTIIALCMAQMTLSLFMKPIFSFLTCICLLVLAIYVSSPCIIGNGAMTLRTGLMPEKNIDLLAAGLVCTAVTILSIVIGTLRFSRMDILGIEE